MKKSLLLISTAALCAASAMADISEPQMLRGLYISSLSPDGRYAVSVDYGNMSIIDLQTGQHYDYLGDESGMVAYDCGRGNSFSANGIMVGSTTSSGDPSYWQNGEWHQLPVDEGMGSVTLGGISADGSLICGFAWHPGADPYGDETMMFPYIWELGDDGKWGSPSALPYPEFDFTGRKPQYISALAVSDDLNTVVGQVRDYSGAFCYPIVYTRDAEGKWTYRLVHDELLNPEKFEFPEWPTVMPQMPEVEDFLGEESMKNYNDALAKWQAETPNDYSTYPVFEDYLSETELDAYNKALDDYNPKALDYNQKTDAFFEVFNACLDSGIGFCFNSLQFTGDGKHLIQTAEQEILTDPSDMWSAQVRQIPYSFHLEDDSYLAHEHEASLRATAVAADGTLLAVSDEELPNSYIKRPDGEWMTLMDYMQTASPDTHKWMQQNMVHTFDLFDPWTGTSTPYEDVAIVGSPLCSSDLSIIATATEKGWEDDDPDSYYYSYILPNASSLSLKCLTAPGSGSFTLKAMRGGMLAIDGGEASIAVYDMQGRLVFASEAMQGAISTGLGAGAYTLKATDAAGKQQVLKVMF